MTIKPLGIADAAWLGIESRDMPMHVGLLLEFTPPPDGLDNFMRLRQDSLRADFKVPAPWNLVPVHAPLAGVLPLVREITDVDLDHHVRWWGLPSPGGQRELGMLVSRLHTQQLDLRRPLWELHIIEGLEAGRFAAFVKLHHSVIDGASAMALITKALSSDPEDRETPHLFMIPAQEIGKGNPDQPVETPKDNWLQALLEGVTRSAGTVLGVGKAGVGLARSSVQDSALQLPFQHPKTPLAERITGQRRLATQQYDLAHIKALSKAADVTINDIVLYLSGTALRSYLAELGVVPESSLTAAIPVNIRREGDFSARTVAASMFVTLATDIADPLERLDAINASAAAAKAHLPTSPDAAMAYTLTTVTPWVAGLAVGRSVRAPQSLGISNVPGPREPLYWNGARLDAMYPMSLLFHGNALNITCISYAGKLNFGFTGARDSLPHMQHLATGMADALEELTTVLLPNGVPR